jgi:predicted naringenin-chalcone synthase
LRAPARSKGRPLTQAHIRSIGTAVPGHDIHAAFVDWAREQVDPGERKVFDRMAARSAIGHRWSVLPSPDGGTSLTSPGGFYQGPVLPGTAERMEAYAAAAPELALAAIEDLARQDSLSGVTHLVVASCTGFVAPGVDQIIAARLGLPANVERLLIGFMGCYAAVAALRSARHIVRSDPAARVLVVCIELSTLHLRQTSRLEPLLAMLQFGDGAAAALVTAEPAGLRIAAPFAATLPASDHLIRWAIGDSGFLMHLSGEVPSRIAEALASPGFADTIAPGLVPGEVDGWAVHAGGRSILDAVARGLGLADHALDASRAVLADNGNMSSATLMFVLARMLAGPPVDSGVALAFGPGLAAEGFRFASAR